MNFSELPSDLNDQIDTLGPPPSWFPVTGVITTSIDPSSLRWYSSQFNGGDPSASIVRTSLSPYLYSHYGDAEEVVNPQEILAELRDNQEMPSNIPLIANRYTEIDPLSPMFRAHRPKYGYGGLGQFEPEDIKNLVKLVAAGAAVYYFLLRKK